MPVILFVPVLMFVEICDACSRGRSCGRWCSRKWLDPISILCNKKKKKHKHTSKEQLDINMRFYRLLLSPGKSPARSFRETPTNDILNCHIRFYDLVTRRYNIPTSTPDGISLRNGFMLNFLSYNPFPVFQWDYDFQSPRDVFCLFFNISSDIINYLPIV